MTHRMLALLGCAAWLGGSVTPCLSFTMDECQQWIDQLRTRTDEITIAGARGDDERKKLLEGVDAARGDGQRGKVRESIDKVKTVQGRAAELEAQGKVSRSDGAQLVNIAEAARRCLEAVEEGGSQRGFIESMPGGPR
jgi:hypothetical protein